MYCVAWYQSCQMMADVRRVVCIQIQASFWLMTWSKQISVWF